VSNLAPLLHATSRTFALSIPLLPATCRDATTVAYLLFRIADTLEDEAELPATRRIEALDEFAALLRGERRDDSRGRVIRLLAAVPVAHAGYAALMANAGEVLQQLDELEPAAAAAIPQHLCRTIAGMRAFLASEQGATSVADLRAYCYAVAGIVGELCTDLFVAATPQLHPVHSQLVRLGVAFGEGLQLVNILKDEDGDALVGRRYVPLHCDRSALFALAEDDLRQAARYVDLLERHGACRGLIAFNALNLQLARWALRRVRDKGSGARLTREEVVRAYTEISLETTNVPGCRRTCSERIRDV
jgi:farnesyl-diphosphate farnesyltransferase